MASTRNALNEVALNVDESMGRRRVDRAAKLSPVSSPKDVGRMPLRTFGAVEVGRIIPDPEQPRRQFDDGDIKRLAKSILKNGQLHPIRVRWDNFLEKWIIVSGERRWRATCAVGLSTINCFFIEGEVTETELLEQQLVENLLRADLKPIEEARGYQSLMELNGWNGKQVAHALHLSTSRVSRALALLDLPDRVQQQVDSGTLSKSSAYEISKLSESGDQVELANRAATGTLPHEKAVRIIKQKRGSKSTSRSGLRQIFAAESGIKVTVTSSERANYHEVELALTEALEEVRHRIRNNVTLF